jgi:transcriptional regulator with XRE-family HTH domain
MSEDVVPYGGARDDTLDRVAELRALTAALAWSQREVARRLEVDERTMRYMYSGQERVTMDVLYALRYLNSAEGRNAVSTERRVADR